VAEKEFKQHLEDLRRRAASNDLTGFAAGLRPLLTDNFDKWFRIVKEQKLIGQFRGLVHIQELQRLFSQEIRPALSEQDADTFGHHLRVCEFLQNLFSQIDTEALALPCAAAHPEKMARAVVRFVEIAHYALQRSARTGLGSVPLTITMSQLAELEGRFRAVLDAGNTILNSAAAKNGLDASHVVSDADLNELLRLAQLHGEMLQVLDLYTYRNVEIGIKRRSLVAKQGGHEADLAAVVGAERSGDQDHVRHSILAPLEVSVHKECDLVPLADSDTFFDFLRKVGSTDAVTAARCFGRAYKNALGIEVCEVIDLETVVTTKAGRFTVNELTRAWAVLHTIALLGQKWNERLAVYRDSIGRPTTGASGARTVDLPVPELDRSWLVRLLAREAELPGRVAHGLIEQFISRPATGRIDLFYKPLLLLSRNIILLPTPYIRGSRFERNLLALIATETDLDQKKKGYLPVSELQQRFKEAEFQALTNFRVKVAHHELTDIDLVAFKDGLLFLGQCKIVIEPDSLYDSWKIEAKLDFAAAQLDTCVAHLDEVRPALFKRLGLAGIREQRVVPFILTNTRQFTERQFRGHPVVDIPYLRFLLAGARESLIGMGSGKIGIGSGRSFIGGRYPTGEELAVLMKRTIHRVHERAVRTGHVMRSVGKLKVHFPSITVRSDLGSRFVVTDEEIFDEDESLF
jgi:hypothetical protein